MTMDWHSSVRTRYKILDNEAHSEDERSATWYMIPWINIQRHLHSERDLFTGFCLTEIWPSHVSCIYSHHDYVLTVSHCQALWETINIPTVSNGKSMPML